LHLQVPQRVPPRIKDIPLDVHPKSNKKINNNRRAKCHKRHIDKILADGGCGDAHFFAHGGTYPKHMPLNKMFKAIHPAKLNTISTKNKGFKK